MVNFTTGIPDCDSHNPAILDLFISPDASICSTMTLPPLGNSDHVAVSTSIDFPSNSWWDALLHWIAYDYSLGYWDGLRDHLRYVPWEDIFKLSASATAREFCEWVQVEIDVYIPHKKYQVKPHLSPWFAAACAAPILHRNHFFRLNQKDKSSDSKETFRQASNRYKRVLEADKLAYGFATCIWLASLLHKLKSYGISYQIFGLISSFLSNRWLHLVLYWKSSLECPLNAGVPQGSILGLTLFLLYNNDLPDDVICNIAIYADDTTLYSNCDQASDLWQQLELASELESDLRDTAD